MKHVVLGVLLVICCAAVASSVYFYVQNQRIVKNPQLVIEKEASDMLAHIGTVMSLPTEKPTIITVVDREKLQDQEFFKKAQNGDKIIVYEQARRLLLYRPVTGMVIDTAPLAFQQTGTPAPTPQEDVVQVVPPALDSGSQ